MTFFGRIRCVPTDPCNLVTTHGCHNVTALFFRTHAVRPYILNFGF